MHSATYKFYRQKKKIQQIIRASYRPEKEWRQDPGGYFLIRINRSKKKIEVGFVSNAHVILKKIVGKNAREIYYTLARKKLLTHLEHAAYLGKELYKAELALKYGLPYRQDFPLQVPLKVKIKLDMES